MRLKGKLVKWDEQKAFGFIAPAGKGQSVFIHKTAFSNKFRAPMLNDVITFSMTKDLQGRYCAENATFTGEKLKPQQAKSASQFSIYISVTFLIIIALAYFLDYLPKNLMVLYAGLSIFTFVAYAFDKSKAQNGRWRTPESTLHGLALAGGWPGAAIAQQLLRHKSKKREFRRVFWLTVVLNISGLLWLYLSHASFLLVVFK